MAFARVEAWAESEPEVIRARGPSLPQFNRRYPAMIASGLVQAALLAALAFKLAGPSLPAERISAPAAVFELVTPGDAPSPKETPPTALPSAAPPPIAVLPVEPQQPAVEWRAVQIAVQPEAASASVSVPATGRPGGTYDPYAGAAPAIVEERCSPAIGETRPSDCPEKGRSRP